MALMSAVDTDIDIDFADRMKALQGLDHVPASMVDNNSQVRRHPSGVYFQDVPTHPLTGLCAFTYDEAEKLGYFKVDFLNNSIYEGVRDTDHLQELMDREPPWELLEFKKVVEELAHLREHYGTVQQIKPQSVDDLAVVLALIRPGKNHLLGKPRDQIDAEIWKRTEGYNFKRAHAIAYAVSIVVQMNLIYDRMCADIDQEKAADEPA